MVPLIFFVIVLIVPRYLSEILKIKMRVFSDIVISELPQGLIDKRGNFGGLSVDTAAVDES
jgi:hypothetical protein